MAFMSPVSFVEKLPQNINKRHTFSGKLPVCVTVSVALIRLHWKVYPKSRVHKFPSRQFWAKLSKAVRILVYLSSFWLFQLLISLSCVSPKICSSFISDQELIVIFLSRPKQTHVTDILNKRNTYCLQWTFTEGKCIVHSVYKWPFPISTHIGKLFRWPRG